VIKQGHKYEYAGREVIAIENISDGIVRVKPIEADPFGAWTGLGRDWLVLADDLKALPMKYFHGQVPA